ncbi:MAG: molybdopterin-dependent oxidoreductase [Desulfurococcaceae archaeon]
MVIKCYLTSNNGLSDKGVEYVVDCPVNNYIFKSISDLTWLIKQFIRKMNYNGELEFHSNENIGTTHMLYKYRICLEDKYIGIRVVSQYNSVIRILFTIPDRSLIPQVSFEKYDASKDIVKTNYRVRSGKIPPGQYYIPNLIVYSILGSLKGKDLSNWRIEIKGEVENEFELNLADLYTLGLKTIKTSFHCVTGWSIDEVEFTGPLLRNIIERAKPRESVKWIYVECLDNYSTIIPIDEALNDDAVIAIEMNGKPLEIEHGYPARLVISQLYGWKSAKWVNRLLFLSEYRDGYWEALGYHPRGRVEYEERFKKF